MSGYGDPEIVARPAKSHHAVLLLKSGKAERVRELIDSYSARFVEDFYTSQPVPETRPTD